MQGRNELNDGSPHRPLSPPPFLPLAFYFLKGNGQVRDNQRVIQARNVTLQEAEGKSGGTTLLTSSCLDEGDVLVWFKNRSKYFLVLYCLRSGFTHVFILFRAFNG